MSALVVGMLLAWTIQSPRFTTLDDAALVTTYETSCTIAQPASDCPWLRRELEVRLLGNLQLLQSIDEPIDRAVLQVAARADFPFLAIFGLDQMQSARNPDEVAAVVWAMDHPSPAVRRLARQVAQRSQSPQLQALLSWGTDSGAYPFDLDPATNDEWAAAFMPEAPRTLKELGLPEYGATYRPSMSDGSLLVFTTRETPQKVLAVLAKGVQTLSGSELAESATQMDTTEIEKISQQMEGVTDQAKIMELTMKLQQAMQTAAKPMEKLKMVRDPEGRYWSLPASGTLPERQVGVGRDTGLNLTTITVLLP
jgi:hypothetical protein